MLKKLLLVALVPLLQACGTFDYKPKEYVLSDGRIPPFQVAGTVQVINLQPSTESTIFFSGAAEWRGDYKRVTEHLRWQLDKEIQKNGTKHSAASQKSIGVKVSKLSVTKRAFHFSSDIDFTVQLGSGLALEKHVTQYSPSDVWTVLDGTLALGVIEILTDPDVKKYLAE
ncbi:MAG: hypothetical protein HZC22_16020 [Rhodocyclales bacterium]|nr:hypothetical protein [Rhodocyclales bacterium]